MGYSTRAAKQALHQAGGNLEEAQKVTLPGLWPLRASWLPAQVLSPPLAHLSGSPVLHDTGSPATVAWLLIPGLDPRVRALACTPSGGARMVHPPSWGRIPDMAGLPGREPG